MKLQVTNGYHPHLEQIARLLQFLLAQGERKKIPRVELAAATGLSNNQVESLTSIAVAYGLVAPHTTVLTELGRCLAQRDPHYDRLESLWIVHYVAASEPEWVVWHRLVNQVFPREDPIVAADVVGPYFSDLEGQYTPPTLRNKLPTEVNAVLWAYAQSGLARLGLLRQEKTGVYRRGAPAELPPLALLYCLLHYRAQHAPASTAIPVAELSAGEGSPGVVLQQGERALRGQLERLQERGLLGVESFGDLDQVRFPQGLTMASVLQRIYGG